MPRSLGKQYQISITMTMTITAPIKPNTMPIIAPFPSPVLETFSLGSKGFSLGSVKKNE